MAIQGIILNKIRGIGNTAAEMKINHFISYHFGNFLYKFSVLRIIAKPKLREFWATHPDCEQQLKSWYRKAEKAKWIGIYDIKAEYPSASILNGNRIVFNIKGNHYRLIVRFNFDYQIGWIRFIGTHAEYDKIDVNNI